MQDESAQSSGQLLERLVFSLGFESAGSFFLALLFVVLALAFAVGMVAFLRKKRTERKEQIENVVEEVQREALQEPLKKQEVIAKPSAPQIPKEGGPESVRASEGVSKPALEVKREPERAVEKPLGSALARTKTGFISKLKSLFQGTDQISDGLFLELESILFTADIGAKTAQKLLDDLREKVAKNEIHDRARLEALLKQQMEDILAKVKSPELASDGLSVYMFVGVNGAGKTTTIGKLGAKLKASGRTVLFGAGDTFRAAAAEQLSIWGERIGAPVVLGKTDADSASVLFDAIKQAQEKSVDVVLCDTAGRLHTKTNLMDELKKVHKVIGKALAGAPHEVFLVIDATMGQNAIMQARQFSEATPLTGIILTKLDGTAKGGVALGIVDELGIPIRYIGVGEAVEDLRAFDAKAYVDALFE